LTRGLSGSSCPVSSGAISSTALTIAGLIWCLARYQTHRHLASLTAADGQSGRTRPGEVSASLALTAVLSYSGRQPQDTPPGIPPVVRAEVAPDPLGPPPLASELERLLMAGRHRTGQYQPQSGQRIIRVFSASLSGDRGETRCGAESPWSYPSGIRVPGALTKR
jgi:hypothetical protein